MPGKQLAQPLNPSTPLNATPQFICTDAAGVDVEFLTSLMLLQMMFELSRCFFSAPAAASSSFFHSLSLECLSFHISISGISQFTFNFVWFFFLHSFCPQTTFGCLCEGCASKLKLTKNGAKRRRRRIWFFK